MLASPAMRYATAALVCLASVITGIPLPQEEGRWVSPCGGSSNVLETSLNLPTPPPQPISTMDLQLLKHMADTAGSLCDEISFTIKSRKTSSEITALDGYPALSVFPNTNASYATGMEIEHVLLNEITRVSKVGVFLEQARKDTYDYTDTITQMENKYVEMLCKMHVLLSGPNVTPVSRDIMDAGYRSLHVTSHIDSRNYLIARDAKKIFDAISEGIGAYLLENSV